MPYKGAKDEPTSTEQQSRTIRVANLDFSADEKDLRALFAECGEIVGVQWGIDEYRKAFLGYADVQFDERYKDTKHHFTLLGSV